MVKNRMNPSKEFIQTSRYKINPHHMSGSLIIVDSEKKQCVDEEQQKQAVKLFTTESVEYYKSLHRKMLKKEPKKQKQNKTHKPEFKLTKKPSCLRKNNTLENNGVILDNYVEFLPKK